MAEIRSDWGGEVGGLESMATVRAPVGKAETTGGRARRVGMFDLLLETNRAPGESSSDQRATRPVMWAGARVAIAMPIQKVPRSQPVTFVHDQPCPPARV